MSKHRKVAWYLTVYPNLLGIIFILISGLLMHDLSSVVLAIRSLVPLMFVYLGFYRGERLYAHLSIAFIVLNTFFVLSQYIMRLRSGFFDLNSSVSPKIIGIVLMGGAAIYNYFYFRAYFSVLKNSKGTPACKDCSS